MNGYAKGLSGKCEKCTKDETLIFLILGLLFVSFVLIT